jgi:hypothetical protein
MLIDAILGWVLAVIDFANWMAHVGLWWWLGVLMILIGLAVSMFGIRGSWWKGEADAPTATLPRQTAPRSRSGSLYCVRGRSSRRR